MSRPTTTSGRVAAIDLGKARVGLAVSDELQMLAHPRPALPGGNPGRLAAELAALAEREGIDRFLVGLPLTMSGEAGVAAQRAIRFCQRLADVSGRDVELVDERLSTVQASQTLRAAGLDARAQKSHLDGAAAAILLQRWLDARAPSVEP
ncbi:MAG: Holliday junction resolvase RuvX [Myxococcota bacterium]